MDEKRLRATISELEAELRSAPNLDTESRRALEQALLQIGAALSVDQKSTSGDRSLIGRLEEAAQKFGGSHPALTDILTRLIDGLGEMGI